MIINLSRIDFGGITGGKSKPEEVFDVQPTTSDQTITPTEGSVFSGGTVRAVTSAIDNNIVSGNIKEGVSILGVAGTHKGEKPEESFNVQPTTAEQTITPTAGSVFSGGTVHAVTSSIDSNIQPENIKEGVSILGVAGTFSGGGSSSIIYDGSFDEDGLRAIGWTDEDIAYFEEVNPHFAWQNDQYKVSDENKALYLLDDPNPSSYKDNPNITFVPKKNMESYFVKTSGFKDMKYIKGIPFYDISNATDIYSLFQNCTSLTTIPLLDTSKLSRINSMFSGCTSLTTIPKIDTSGCTDMYGVFQNCTSLTTIPLLDTSHVTGRMMNMFSGCTNLHTIPPINVSQVDYTRYMFQNCTNLTTIPRLDTANAGYMDYMFSGCTSLSTVEGIDFSGLTSELTKLFGTSTSMPNLKRFIVNGKINVSIKDNNSIKALTAIDYDSVKSILAAADRTDNTNAKTLAFNRTMTDQNGELAALVSSCTSKGWTISGLTLQ